MASQDPTDKAGGSAAIHPLPVSWTAEREQRGKAPDRGARCTEPGCPVRYAGGDSRPCAMHADDGEMTALDARDWSLNRLRTLRPGQRWPSPATVVNRRDELLPGTTVPPWERNGR